MNKKFQSIVNGMNLAIGLNVMRHAVEVFKGVDVQSKHGLVMVDHPVEVERLRHEHVTLKTAQVSPLELFLHTKQTDINKMYIKT